MTIVIGVDVDGVVADLHTEWLRLYNADYDDHLTSEDITAWNTHEFVKPECGKKIYSYLSRADLYDRVEPIFGSQYGVSRLRHAGYQPVFVTSNVKGMTDPKWKWLEKFDFLKSKSELVVMHDKSLLNANVLIDDGAHNIKAFRGGKPLLFDAPWNRSESLPRVCGWSEVLEALSIV
jgi:5'-nucleotidase